jgi:hypothetical protein
MGDGGRHRWAKLRGWRETIPGDAPVHSLSQSQCVTGLSLPIGDTFHREPGPGLFQR